MLTQVTHRSPGLQVCLEVKIPTVYHINPSVSWEILLNEVIDISQTFIAVVGGGECSPEVARLAEEVG